MNKNLQNGFILGAALQGKTEAPINDRWTEINCNMNFNANYSDDVNMRIPIILEPNIDVGVDISSLSGNITGAQYDTYIQSNGTQWINTGIVPNSEFKIEIMFKIHSNLTSLNYVCPFGSRNKYVSSQVNAFSLHFNSNNSHGRKIFCYGTSEPYIDTSTYYDNKCKVIVNKNICTIENNLTSDTITAPVQTFTGEYPIYLFALNDGGTSGPIKMDLFYCKIWNEDGILLRDFIPTISQENGHKNEVGVYDTVTESYFYNQGTGSFTFKRDSGSASIGDTLGLSTSFDIDSCTKQWQRNIPDIDIPDNLKEEEANTTLCILNGRTYKKTRTGFTYVAYMFNGSYTGPLLVSESHDAVIFNGGGGEQIADIGTIKYEGTIYYYGSAGYWMGGNVTDTSGLNRIKFNVPNCAEGAKMLLDYINKEYYVYENIDGAIYENYTTTSQDVSHKVRCKITGTQDLIGSTNTNSIEVK